VEASKKSRVDEQLVVRENNGPQHESGDSCIQPTSKNGSNSFAQVVPHTTTNNSFHCNQQDIQTQAGSLQKTEEEVNGEGDVHLPPSPSSLNKRLQMDDPFGLDELLFSNFDAASYEETLLGEDDTNYQGWFLLKSGF
jgi:hypothetical protein